jgi:hypothetical protein
MIDCQHPFAIVGKRYGRDGMPMPVATRLATSMHRVVWHNLKVCDVRITAIVIKLQRSGTTLDYRELPTRFEYKRSCSSALDSALDRFSPCHAQGEVAGDRRGRDASHRSLNLA